ncbi:MAG: SIS domain-containing protein, partial [Candidatus Aenigmatarchaeota archaeon]
MSNTIQNYRKICDEAIQLANTIKLNFSNPERIIFAGMGGSGIAGNLVKDVANLDIPIEVSKGYTLPSLTNSNSLVVCISYSGNTEETLYQFVEAVKRKCAIFSISSGGKLLEWSKKLDIPFVQLPSGYEPREALPYLFFSALSILEKLNLKDYSSGKNEFLNLMEKIDLKRIDKIANDIKDSLIFIYGSTEFSGVLRRIKNELNENSKLRS